MTTPEFVSAAIRAYYDSETKAAAFAVVGTQPEWLTLSQESGSWIYKISTSDSVVIDLVPGPGLQSIAGLSFDKSEPTTNGFFAAGSWEPDLGHGILLSDTSSKLGAWDFEILGGVPLGGSVTFDPKIYNEGGG
jgi:hypothetical protein